MRVLATSRVAEADVDRFEAWNLPFCKSAEAVSKLKWSLHDSNVSWTASRLQPQMHLLPWETGLAGEVLGTKRRKILETISDRPMQLGKRDFFTRRCFVISAGCPQAIASEVAWTCTQVETYAVASR